jgi:putative membrane protein
MIAFVEYQWHPEVWLLVAFLAGAYVYMVRVIGPAAVPAGSAVVTRRHWIAFAAAITLTWVASDWPMHDISEKYLYSMHMFQHMILSYFVPPLALAATPTWLMRVLLGDGAIYNTVRWFARPVVAGVLFNAAVIIIHIPGLVNASLSNGALHYLLHVMVVVAGLLMWMPVVGPLPEMRIGPMGASIYLFLMSVVPTVPAAWLALAESVVYAPYGEQTVRLWGVSALSDQQFAGAVMKVAGGLYLWAFVVYFFFARFAKSYAAEHDYRRSNRMPDAEIVGHDEVALTTADVEREFANSHPRPDHR